jgi:predicted NBD/HSP70 family sugar kinase
LLGDLSARGLEASSILLSGGIAAAKAGETPPALTARDVFAAAQDGDELAQRIVDQTADLIGLGVANIISLVNPELVILGGSVGAQPALLPRVRETVRDWAQPVSAAAVQIVSSTLATDAALLGAAYAARIRGSRQAPAQQLAAVEARDA